MTLPELKGGRRVRTRETYEDYDILQIMPGPPGLCAVYLCDDGLLKSPVMGYALVRFVRRYTDTDRVVEWGRPHRSVLPLVTGDESELRIESTSETGNFLGVQHPTEPDTMWDAEIARRRGATTNVGQPHERP
jgi:hypothetical protein